MDKNFDFFLRKDADRTWVVRNIFLYMNFCFGYLSWGTLHLTREKCEGLLLLLVPFSIMVSVKQGA